MKNLIKGLVENGNKVTFKEDQHDGWYVIDVNDGQFEFFLDDWNEAEEVLLDYIINEANL